MESHSKKGASGGVAAAGGTKTIKRRMNMNDLRNISLFLLTVCLLTACTQNEPADGTSPAEERYPLVLTASVGATTRATVDNYWDGDETVYVQIKEDYGGEETIDWTGIDPIPCTISTDDKKTIVFPTTSKWANFYWSKDTPDMFIRAWRSGTVSVYNLSSYSDEDRSIDNINTAAEWSVNYHQYSTINYKNSDFVFAQKKVTFDEDLKGVALKFYHQVAKIIVNVNAAPLEADATTISSVYIDYVNYSILPLFTFTAPNTTEIYGKWSKPNSDRGLDYVRMRGVSGSSTSFEAIVIPQTTSTSISNKAGFTINAQVTHGSTNQSIAFRCYLDNAQTWEPGRVYTYTLNLTPSGLQLGTIDVNTSWDTTGTSDSGEIIL